MEDLKINKDYKFGYPLGLEEGPVIVVKKGAYVGLIVHLEASWLESTTVHSKTNHTLHYKYNIRKMWNSAGKIIGKKITLDNDAQEFIYSLVHSFIKATNN